MMEEHPVLCLRHEQVWLRFEHGDVEDIVEIGLGESTVKSFPNISGQQVITFFLLVIFTLNILLCNGFCFAVMTLAWNFKHLQVYLEYCNEPFDGML
ncbi:unnamed protein product [Vicia faba]|uniref:Uncharacterized protein n=1 Tax=Vicia faba TaxID=3906 RepID=A0AAV1AQJ6_VICFA|nr:unnamed protein product [Vicia faba]